MLPAKKIMLLAVLASFAVSLYYYPSLPDNMATHWDFSGNVNGYMPKVVGAFLMPALMIVLAGLLLLAPKLDPLKKNYTGKFNEKYRNLSAIIVLFLLMLHIQVLSWNAGLRIGFDITLPLGVGILIFYVGDLCMHAEKRNWFIGVRTPWSMSSDRVWRKTNLLCGKLFKVAGAISVLGALAGDYSILFVIVPIVTVSVFAFIYSYIEYRKEK